MRDAKGGDSFPKGIEYDTWADEDLTKYIAVGPPPPEIDVFTALLRGRIFDSFHRFLGEPLELGTEIDEESGLRSYSDSRVNRAASLVTVILSSMTPVLAIFALNAAHTLEMRLGLVALFTGLFAAILAVFSSARRVEIFAATAA